jgi:hypothetical protein
LDAFPVGRLFVLHASDQLSMSLFPGKIENFYAGRAGGLHTFRVDRDDAGDGDFLAVAVIKVHDLRPLALGRALGLELHLWLYFCRRVLLLRGAHAADELAGFLWREVFRVLVFDWEQRAAFDDTFNLKVPWKLLEMKDGNGVIITRTARAVSERVDRDWNLPIRIGHMHLLANRPPTIRCLS